MATPLILWSGRDLLVTSFHCGTFQWKKFTVLLTTPTLSTLQSSLLLRCESTGFFFWYWGFQRTSPLMSTHKILVLQTHFKPTETFQYTHFSSCHPLNCKKGFIKGGAFSLLRTKSVRENLEKSKRDYEHRLCQRGFNSRSRIYWLKLSCRQKRGPLQQNKTNTRDFIACYYLQSGHIESEKDSHETPAHHSTAT